MVQAFWSGMAKTSGHFEMPQTTSNNSCVDFMVTSQNRERHWPHFSPSFVHWQSFVTLDNMLQDQIVFGINNRNIQQRLLAEKILTLAKTMELTQGMETAAKNVIELSQLEVPSILQVLGMCTE